VVGLGAGQGCIACEDRSRLCLSRRNGAGRRRRKRQGRGEKETMMAVARGRAPVPPCRPRACSVPPRCRPVHAPRRFFPLSAVPSSSHGSQRFDRPASSAMEMVQRARRRCWSVDQPSCSSSVHHTRALPVPRLLSRPARLASPGQEPYPGEAATDGWNAPTALARPVENRSRCTSRDEFRCRGQSEANSVTQTDRNKSAVRLRRVAKQPGR
jgi:hypothetical protein